LNDRGRPTGRTLPLRRRVTTLYEGTFQIQKLIIGRDATGVDAILPFAPE
jgi:alkylation response protein AidB-like acyl-CoA dehydrogenase